MMLPVKKVGRELMVRNVYMAGIEIEVGELKDYSNEVRNPVVTPTWNHSKGRATQDGKKDSKKRSRESEGGGRN